MRKIFVADKYETTICNLYINKIRDKIKNTRHILVNDI